MCICLRKENKHEKGSKYIEVSEPGERLSVDILEITPNCKIIVAIDYFSRYLFAKIHSTKESEKILNFLKIVHETIPFKTLVSDNGKEFDNKKLDEWLKSKEIKHKFTVPYYHKGNGRIERVNRTLREALRKTNKPPKICLKDIVENYNNIKHRGIGMAPKVALKKDNWKLVLKNTENYKKEFKKTKENSLFMDGDLVYIRNEFRRSKMDDYFTEKGVIKKRLYGDVYEILKEDGKRIRRHKAQIKLLRRGKLDDVSQTLS